MGSYCCIKNLNNNNNIVNNNVINNSIITIDLTKFENIVWNNLFFI